MKFVFSIFITVFISTFVYAQETNHKKAIAIFDSIKVTNKIDTTVLHLFYNSIDLNRMIQYHNQRFDNLFINEISEMVVIKRELLDSLLNPFYNVSLDTVRKDTISNDLNIPLKYRMSINEIFNDTSYVPLPKEKHYFNWLKTYGIDRLIISQPIKPKPIAIPKMAKEPNWWETSNSIGLDINEVAFSNWSAGGSNSVSGLLKIYFARNFEKIYTLWKNEISARYGLNEQQDKGLLKTDDEIKINSTYGYRKDSISKWYYSLKFNFRTQFTDGFKYPNTDDPISRFFAPAYLFFGAGTEYNLKSKSFSIFLSPLTLKSTFVIDDTLSNEGAFGVEKGKKSRHEFGALVQSKWDTRIFKNVAMTNTIGFYSDYLNNFGNIDVDWFLSFKFHINKFLEANFSTHLIYDDDIKHKEDTNGDGVLETLGPRVQIKQQIGIGILYKF